MTGSHTTTSTSYVDVNAAYSIAVHAVVGDVLAITFSASVTNSGTNTNYFRFLIGGTSQGPAKYYAPGVATFDCDLNHVYYHTVASGDIASGTVTVKPQWKVSAATGTIRNEGTNFGAPMFVVQNVGPVDPN